MSQDTAPSEAVHEPVLNPVDRISELIFGLRSRDAVGATALACSSPLLPFWPVRAAQLTGRLKSLPK